MNFCSLPSTWFRTSTAAAPLLLALAALLGMPLEAGAAPAQKPLLTTVAGAKPNLMLTVDNSGSMGFTYSDSYSSSDESEYVRKFCPAPFSNSNSQNQPTFNAGVGGEVVPDGNGTYSCYSSFFDNRGRFRPQEQTTVSLPFVPNQLVSNFLGQRSADFNPVYYNPRTRYLPRVDSSGVALVATDGLQFVSNQGSAPFTYRVYSKNNTTPASYQTFNSTFQSETNTGTTGNNELDPFGFTLFSNAGTSVQNKRVPVHAAYPNPRTSPANPAPTSSTPAFTYAYCATVAADSSGNLMCINATRVNVKFGGTNSFTVPASNNRSDCSVDAGTGVATCSTDKEIANILNWYRYYITRSKASATAIGQALANTDLYSQIRVGYTSINRDGVAMDLTPGGATADLRALRGVRLHTQGGADTNQTYNWLYGTIPMGGTPLHNSVDKVANYYKLETGVGESPWATNPVTGAGGEKTCRRSFNLLFSDGAWNSGTSTNSTLNADATDGPEFTKQSDNTKFKYTHQGLATLGERSKYTPYPSANTGGLADLTASYFWHTDMRPLLDNEIEVSSGQPAFWQNMATYTVGYLIQPSGAVTGATSGLTFAQIDRYRREYLTLGYSNATKPSWATANSTDALRVDDFIQAGYTGGGKGYSAQSADDVRRIFNLILSDVLSASGNDAGVSVSSSASGSATIAGRLKYGVTYRTIDNSGDVIAYNLNANGATTGVAWTAGTLMPSPLTRNVYTISGTNTPIEFKGRFDALSADVQAALKQGPDASRIPSDASFVNYLRGTDPVVDSRGALFRVRSSPMGGMVNPPSIYMGGQSDSTYDLHGTVQGSASYRQFTDRKRAYPASLYVATNAGEMHALNATSGNELSAFRPRRSLKRMLHYADEAYTFEYTLDGPLSQHDVYDTAMVQPDATWKRWKHIAIGTGGRGEPLIYAINSPMNIGVSGGVAANRIPGKTDFLWETGPDAVDSTTGNDKIAMGYISNPLPMAGQTYYRDADNKDLGEWIVVANNGHYNGYESTGKRAGLVVLNPATGAVIKRLPLPAGADAGRGLSGVTILRDTGDTNQIVGAYAGDANGNLWKFNLKGASSTWGVAYGKPLFTTPNHRPIYGTPAWQPHPKGGFIVVVATGMMLEDSDLSDTANKEWIYGIWDPTPIKEADESPFATVEDSDLLLQSVTTSTATNGTGTLKDNIYYKTTKNSIDWKVSNTVGTHRGWKMQLGYISKGERSIAEVQNLRTSVMISTTVLAPPSNTAAEVCKATSLPGNYVYLLNALDGKHTKAHSIDGDNKLEDFAVAYLPNGGFTRGVNVVKLPTTTGVVVTDPNDPTGSTGGTTLDPKSALSDQVREEFRINEAGGESKTQTCSGDDVRNAQGTVSGGLPVGVSCPNTGWSRTQYQLAAPPSK